MNKKRIKKLALFCARLIVPAAVIAFAAVALVRLDYGWEMNGAEWYPVQVGSGYYYVEPHRGIRCWTDRGSGRVLLNCWYWEDWRVNDYGIYYSQGRRLYVRDHDSGCRTLLRSEKPGDCTEIQFELDEGGNIIYTVLNEKTGRKTRLLLDGVTGEVLETLAEETEYTPGGNTEYTQLPCGQWGWYGEDGYYYYHYERVIWCGKGEDTWELELTGGMSHFDMRIEEDYISGVYYGWSSSGSDKWRIERDETGKPVGLTLIVMNVRDLRS